MAAMKKSGLGKGLDSLITNKMGIDEDKKNINPDKSELFVSIAKVEPNREQPRKSFDEDSLFELSESIKQFGILQPLIVQDRKDYYEIIAGERRWRAAKIAGLKEIPIIIKKLTNQEAVEISLIENIQREDLNPIEEAMAYKRLLEEFNLKQDEVADRVSKSRTAVTNSIRLLKLNSKVQQMVIDDLITTGHARTLLAIQDNDLQYSIAQKIFDEKLSVRETEKLVKKFQTEKIEILKEGEKVDSISIVYENLEQQLKDIIGTKVTIHCKNNEKGKIEIDYYNKEELERIVELFQSIHE
jgi:ParB family chromosome partitioning protein